MLFLHIPFTHAWLQVATGCFRHLRQVFQELEETRPFELLKGQVGVWRSRCVCLCVLCQCGFNPQCVLLCLWMCVMAYVCLRGEGCML